MPNSLHQACLPPIASFSTPHGANQTLVPGVGAPTAPQKASRYTHQPGVLLDDLSINYCAFTVLSCTSIDTKLSSGSTGDINSASDPL